MPKFTIDIHNTQQNVTRPIVFGIVYDLVSALGIPQNVRVMTASTEDGEDLPIRTAEDERNLKFDPRLKTIVTYTEMFAEDRAAVTVVKKNENKPLFHDEELGILISPIYAHSEVNLSLEWRFSDRASAHAFRNDIRKYASLFREGLMHEISYNYTLPKVCSVLLVEFHAKRESQAGYGDSLRDYLQPRFSEQMDVTANVNDTYRSLVKREIQTAVMGEFDFQITPENPESADSKATHFVRFNYKVRYDKPLSVYMEYPILIHNTPINSKYYDTTVPFELGLRLQIPSRTGHHLDHYTQNQYVTGFENGAPIPQINDWQPSTTIPGQEGLLRVMILVNPEDRRGLLNFNELGELELKPFIIEYLQMERTTVMHNKQAVFFVALYENDKPLEGSMLEIDEELNLRTTFDMDLRKNYHVYFSIVWDQRSIDQNAIQRLCQHGEIARSVLDAIDGTLLERNLLPRLLKTGGVTLPSYRRAINSIIDRVIPEQGKPRGLNLRVGNFMIAVHSDQ